MDQIHKIDSFTKKTRIRVVMIYADTWKRYKLITINNLFLSCNTGSAKIVTIFNEMKKPLFSQ